MTKYAHTFIDTHAHLYASQFDKDRDAMMARAKEAGIAKMFLPNIDLDSIEGMYALESQYPNVCYAMMGLHPCSVGENYKTVLAKIEKHLAERPFVAIGEIGIDLYWEDAKKHFKEQKETFITQIQWAKSLGIPFVIHARESLDEIINIVAQEQDGSLKGIFHCFTGTSDQAKKIIDLGFLMGLGGVLTYKNSGLDKVVAEIDTAHFVLETDAPYLAPVPKRGKRNESSYITHIAQKLADIKNENLEAISSTTNINVNNLFLK